MSKKDWNSTDIHWHVKNRKTPIAYSTLATSDYITILAREHNTIQDMYNNIVNCEESKKVLNEYIKRGYANHIFKIDNNGNLLFPTTSINN